jgi:hypothetical protein
VIGRLLSIIGLKIMPNSEAQLIRKFKGSRKQVTKIQAEYESGEITREEFQTRMREQMVLDDKNTWWSIRAETGAWYKFVDGDWDLAPLPVSIPEEEALAKSNAEKRKYQPWFIDDRPIRIQLEPPGPQDANKVLSPSLNSQLSDEDIRREAQEALRKFLEKERQQKSQKPSFDEDK